MALDHPPSATETSLCWFNKVHVTRARTLQQHQVQLVCVPVGKHGLGQLLFNFSLHILKVFEASDWRQRDIDSLSLRYREQVVRDWEIQGEAQLAPASPCVSSPYLNVNAKIQQFLLKKKKKSKLFILNGK